MRIMTDNLESIQKAEDKTKGFNRPLVLCILLFLTVMTGIIAIGLDDMECLLRWDLALFVLGMAVLPFTSVLFGRIHPGTYFFGKTIGLAICAYITWLFASIGVVGFTVTSCIVFLIITAVAVYGIAFYTYKKKKTLLLSIFSLETVLGCELIFLIILLFFTWYLEHRVPSTETERMMNYAFMVTLSKSSTMPPADLWAAGDSLNYYYFGHYLITYLSKLSFVDPSAGYTLGMNTIATFCCVFSYMIVAMLLALNSKCSRLLCNIGGLVGGVAVTFCGNMHYVIFYKIAPMLWEILRIEGQKPSYWFANSTRYIGYIPQNDLDKTITEFPIYSFLIGDLHAHVIDIMMTLTIMGLLIAYSANDRIATGGRAQGTEDVTIWKRLICDVTDSRLLLIAFVLGISAMTNFWNYPIYFVVSLCIITATSIKRNGINGYTCVMLLPVGLIFIGISQLVLLPFSLSFDMMFNGVRLCQMHSKFYQLVVLWGLPVSVLIIFAFYLFVGRKKGRIQFSDILTMLIGLSGVGLVIMAEIVFLADIYISSFPRCNTMFKLTYQTFIFFGIVMGYCIVRVLSDGIDDISGIKEYVSERRIRTAMSVCAFLLVCTLGYFFTAGRMWFGKLKFSSYKGLDCTLQLKEDLAQEMDAVDWINENITGDEVILVSYGDSYTNSCMIPVLTGHPTVVGWSTHEWLWRNSRDYVTDRQIDVRDIYEGTDAYEVERLITKYGIDYIYVGPMEYEKFGYLNIELLESLGEVVYRDNNAGSVLIRVRGS